MSHQAIEIVEVEDAAVENNTAGSAARSTGEDHLGSMMKLEPSTRSTSLPRISDEASPSDAVPASLYPASISCLDRVRRELGKVKKRFPGRKNYSPTIFKFPRSLIGVNRRAEVPEIVSIGPYYYGSTQLLEFQQHKWFFLQRFLHHSAEKEESLIKHLAANEYRIRDCYSERVNMTGAQFLEMMLLDCCFVLELLNTFKRDDPNDEGDPIFTQPWILPVLIRDLLKLGNQVPFFILQDLNSMRNGITSEESDFLCVAALEVIDQVHPRSKAAKENFSEYPQHLLHLFYSTLVPTKQHECTNLPNYRPLDQSIPCVTKLWSSGIKFKSINTKDFLGISLRKRVLEIPSITVDDFTTTMLINCLALEHCQDSSSRDITDYVSFMHCLISHPMDVSLLCSNGIITRFSHNDHYVASFFNELGKRTVFNVRDCYLSRQFEELESYYNSNWAYIKRTYFSSPWSGIALFSAFLGISLTVIQTVYTVFGHHSR